MDNNVIAVEEGLKRLVNNKKLYFRLLKKFSARKFMDQIFEFVAQGNSDEAIKSCHSLRGTASNLAMNALADVTLQLEEKLVAGEPVDDMLPLLRENLEAVEKAIEEITSDE